MASDEEIRRVVGFESQYSVTRDGRVWSHVRRRWMVPDLSRDRGDGKSYPRIQLRRDGKPHFKLLSHIVLEAWVGPRPEGMLALHQDDDPSNSQLDNLEWGTHQKNMIHMVMLRGGYR